MAGDGMMRASDADRDAVVVVLRDAYAAGRLTLDEFGERTSAAYTGRTWGELRELTADLPEQPLLGADVPGHAVVATTPLIPPQAALPPGQGDPVNQGDPLRQGDPLHHPGGPRDPRSKPDPARIPPGAPHRRQRPAGAVMPFVMVWFLIVLATRSPAAVAAPVVVLALLLLFTAMSRRK